MEKLREKKIFLFRNDIVEKYLCININEQTITGNNNEHMLFDAIDKNEIFSNLSSTI